jgi:hypothetical protein
MDILGDEQLIKTAQIKDWKKMKWPDLKDKPAVFLIQA